jgi:hypothetical protein
MTTLAANSERYVYRIDACDKICFVNSDWLRFAVDNDAPELDAARVIGASLWDHVQGEEVQRLYRELFIALRARVAELVIPFNCDSPTMVRNMTLTLRTLQGGHIELEGRIHSAVEREPVRLLDRRSPRAAKNVAICSCCRRLQVRDEWVAIDAALVRYRWMTVTPAPQLVEAICPKCQRLPI